MSLRFCDSFDHYTSADIPEKWTAVAGVPVISAGTGRRSTASCRCPINAAVTLTLDAQQVWIIGYALRFTTATPSSTTLMQWLDVATIQCDLALLPTGQLTVRRNGVTVLGTTTNALSINTTYYLEWRLLIDNAVGQTEVRVNGVAWLTLTGVDTQQSANAFANQVKCGQVTGNSSGNLDMDDLYICDQAGAAPHNTFLGDCRVDTLLPTGDGASSAWTPSTGTTHSTLVDEATPNDDTDYLSTLTVGARDTHIFTDLPPLTNPLILGVQHCISARKDDVGLRQLKSVLKSGATTQAGPTTQTMASTYIYYRELWPVDPGTGVAWTVAGVDALEAGFDNLV